MKCALHNYPVKREMCIDFRDWAPRLSHLEVKVCLLHWHGTQVVSTTDSPHIRPGMNSCGWEEREMPEFTEINWNFSNHLCITLFGCWCGVRMFYTSFIIYPVKTSLVKKQTNKKKHSWHCRCDSWRHHQQLKPREEIWRSITLLICI